MADDATVNSIADIASQAGAQAPQPQAQPGPAPPQGGGALATILNILFNPNALAQGAQNVAAGMPFNAPQGLVQEHYKQRNEMFQARKKEQHEEADKLAAMGETAALNDHIKNMLAAGSIDPITAQGKLYRSIATARNTQQAMGNTSGPQGSTQTQAQPQAQVQQQPSTQAPSAPQGISGEQPAPLGASKLPQATTDIPHFQTLLDAAKAQGIKDPAHFLSMTHAESGFNEKATSPKGAIGITQVMPDTARGLGYQKPAMLYDPKIGSEAGARYYKQMEDQFNGNKDLIAAAYNAGPEAVTKYGGIPPYKETQEYVKRVNSYHQHYTKLLNGQPSQEGTQPTGEQVQALPTNPKAANTTTVSWSGSSRSYDPTTNKFTFTSTPDIEQPFTQAAGTLYQQATTPVENGGLGMTHPQALLHTMEGLAAKGIRFPTNAPQILDMFKNGTAEVQKKAAGMEYLYLTGDKGMSSSQAETQVANKYKDVAIPDLQPMQKMAYDRVLQKNMKMGLGEQEAQAATRDQLGFVPTEYADRFKPVPPKLSAGVEQELLKYSDGQDWIAGRKAIPKNVLNYAEQDAAKTEGQTKAITEQTTRAAGGKAFTEKDEDSIKNAHRATNSFTKTVADLKAMAFDPDTKTFDLDRLPIGPLQPKAEKVSHWFPSMTPAQYNAKRQNLADAASQIVVGLMDIGGKSAMRSLGTETAVMPTYKVDINNSNPIEFMSKVLNDVEEATNIVKAERHSLVSMGKATNETPAIKDYDAIIAKAERLSMHLESILPPEERQLRETSRKYRAEMEKPSVDLDAEYKKAFEGAK